MNLRQPSRTGKLQPGDNANTTPQVMARAERAASLWPKRLRPTMARMELGDEMAKLEEIKAGVSLEGVEPDLVVTDAAVVPIDANALTIFYKLPDGTLKERLLGRADEPGIRVASKARPWSFDGDGAAFLLTTEAKRIDLAFLFDPMMAVHASNVEPLPHQITAVYESMLPKQPLRRG